MKIALDVMGGDNAPDINVDGAKRALQDFPLIEKISLGVLVLLLFSSLSNCLTSFAAA